MEPVAPPAARLTPSVIAKDWAGRGHPVSRQYVAKLMTKGVGGEKLEGEHLASLDAAWSWRTSRTDFLKLAKGGGVAPPGAGEGKAEGTGHSPPAGGVRHFEGGAGGDSLEAMLERVRGVEEDAFARWAKAKGYEQAAEAKAWQTAMRNRVDAEALVAANRKRQGLTVDLADVQVLVDVRLNPLRGALQTLDREIAKELFPEAPAMHRPRIRRVIARVCVASLAVARAKQPLHPSFAHGRDRAA
jgi:hypothetical protein